MNLYNCPQCKSEYEDNDEVFMCQYRSWYSEGTKTNLFCGIQCYKEWIENNGLNNNLEVVNTDTRRIDKTSFSKESLFPEELLREIREFTQKKEPSKEELDDLLDKD